VPSGGRARPVPGELDELELVADMNRSGEIGQEDEARLERGD